MVTSRGGTYFYVLDADRISTLFGGQKTSG